MTLLIIDAHSQAELDAGGTLRVLNTPKYQGDPTFTDTDGTIYTYDPKGVTGPQLLNDDLGHERQAESDANWPKNKEMTLSSRSEQARIRLNELDSLSLRDLRKYVASQLDAPQTLKDFEIEAITERTHVR